MDTSTPASLVNSGNAHVYSHALIYVLDVFATEHV